MHPKHKDALVKKAEALSAKIDRIEQRLAEMNAENAKPEPTCSCPGCVGYEKPPRRYELFEWFAVWRDLQRLRSEQTTLHDERQRLGLPELERLWAIPEWDGDIVAEHEAWCYFTSWI